MKAHEALNGGKSRIDRAICLAARSSLNAY
jgi:hypothetical protein